MGLKDLLRRELGSTKMESYGRAGGGCINEGEGFMTDFGPIFVKKNKKKEAKLMFDGENQSLKSLYATNTIRVPKPIASIDNPDGGALFVAEYIDMNGRGGQPGELGTKMARLHLHNGELLKKAEERANWVTDPPEGFNQLAAVKEFGFHCTTCCGFIPQDNSWCEDWVQFYTQRKLKAQIDMILSSKADRELSELWSALVPKIPNLFTDCKEIVPALLHGDLWGGNVSGTDTEPVIFDPASFYGHSEFEFGIATIFGGFDSQSFKTYHKLIPKAPGFERRLPLYQLFHYLNHWNHFGTGYRGSSISIMRQLVK